MGNSEADKAPARIARGTHGREYVWPTRPPHELVVPSTTSILKQGLPKAALPYWAAQVVAEYAYDHVGAWSTLPRADAVDLLKRSPYRSIRDKAALGTSIHAAIEALARGERPDLQEQEQRGYWDAALAFVDDWRPSIMRTEAIIYSRAHRYAGTADALATVKGEPAIIDYKTGKGIYPEYALQLAAYAYGDFVGEDDTEVPLSSLGPFRLGLIVRLSADGSYECQAVNLDRSLFEVFLAAKTIFLFKRDPPDFGRFARA